MVEDGGENSKKGGEERCHLEELGLAGEAVGAEASAEVGEEAGLDGVVPMLGAGLAMVCLMVIPMGDMDMVTHTIVTAQRGPMATTHGKDV